MSHFLVDTHVLLWVYESPEKLSRSTLRIIEDRKDTLLVSTATLWEIAIKAGLKKIRVLPENYLGVLKEHGYTITPITPEQALEVRKLPLLHRDPFDRMLVTQAKTLRVPIITGDRQIAQYEVEIIPA